MAFFSNNNSAFLAVLIFKGNSVSRNRCDRRIADYGIGAFGINVTVYLDGNGPLGLPFIGGSLDGKNRAVGYPVTGSNHGFAVFNGQARKVALGERDGIGLQRELHACHSVSGGHKRVDQILLLRLGNGGTGGIGVHKRLRGIDRSFKSGQSGFGILIGLGEISGIGCDIGGEIRRINGDRVNLFAGFARIRGGINRIRAGGVGGGMLHRRNLCSRGIRITAVTGAGRRAGVVFTPNEGYGAEDMVRLGINGGILRKRRTF